MNYINYSYSLDKGRSTGSIESINFIKYTYKRVCWVYKIPLVPGYSNSRLSRGHFVPVNIWLIFLVTNWFVDGFFECWKIFCRLAHSLFWLITIVRRPEFAIFRKKKCEIWKLLEINFKKSVNHTKKTAWPKLSSSVIAWAKKCQKVIYLVEIYIPHGHQMN